MSNQTTDLPTRLNHLKKTFYETFQDVSLAKDVEKIIDRLMNHFPQDQEWKQELVTHLNRYREIISSDFRSIRKELAEIDGFLRRLADEDDFKALSEKDRVIIDKADEDPRVKCHRVSYEFFLRLDEHKHDPRIFLFLAIFPENAVLRKRFLIYWWIGEGLVPNEEEGERVFEQLLDLDLLLPYRTDKNPRVSKCQIFPWIRYMLISEAQKEKHLKLEDDNIPRFDPTHSRRACLIADHTNLASESESSPESLRTLFNVNERDLDFQHQWLTKLKTLVVLQLGRWQASPTHHIEVRDESFLKGLKTQKHLKYLSLRGISRITALPESIRELVSLEILDLKACHNLETLPAAFMSLKKLTHLDVSECYLLEKLPKGFDKLTSLQVLKGLVTIGHSHETPISIAHLRSLKNLKRLSIHIATFIQKDELEKLKDLEKLKCLKIYWDYEVVQENLHENLSFPSGLEKLVLEGIRHETMPEWLRPSKLSNLETLCIKGGRLTSSFDEGEQWNKVKYLVLKYTNLPQMNLETLKSIFPSLRYVKKVELKPNREEEEVPEHEWNKDETVTG